MEGEGDKSGRREKKSCVRSDGGRRLKQGERIPQLFPWAEKKDIREMEQTATARGDHNKGIYRQSREVKTRQKRRRYKDIERLLP